MQAIISNSKLDLVEELGAYYVAYCMSHIYASEQGYKVGCIWESFQKLIWGLGHRLEVYASILGQLTRTRNTFPIQLASDTTKHSNHNSYWLYNNVVLVN